MATAVKEPLRITGRDCFGLELLTDMPVHKDGTFPEVTEQHRGDEQFLDYIGLPAPVIPRQILKEDRSIEVEGKCIKLLDFQWSTSRPWVTKASDRGPFYTKTPVNAGFPRLFRRLSH
ncbi:hypothetical protein [Rhizobium sp. ZPR3]|uniref:Uncharacterized protein n=2 Tax=unclassified Rhizobium TaxID=2613769 RepID=A0AAU7SSD0_9HYPH